jgi:nucleotide-binding universal stress UspA family protein
VFRRILIPTDFSTASEWIFDDAIRIAAATGAELLILHVRMTWSSHPDELRFPADPSLYEYAEQLELERLRQRVHGRDIATRLLVRKAPDAGGEICRTAAAENVDLIVIATHARHHLAHFFIGSTTHSVITDPPAPVMAIRYGTRKRTSMRKAVVPVHPQQTSRAALELATRVVTHESGELHLLTVCRDDEQSTAADLHRQLAPNATHALVRGSDAAREIVRYAKNVDADVVFLNAKAEPGEVKLDIVRHSPTPVVITPATSPAP